MLSLFPFRVKFQLSIVGSGDDETGVSRKMRCYLGDKIKDEEPCLSLKIRSYPGDKIGEKHALVLE